MSEFWYTTATMQSLYGETYTAFKLFGPVHCFWLAVCAILTYCVYRFYPKCTQTTKRRIIVLLTVLLLIDEAVKDVSSLATGQFIWEYLPLHLCSVNLLICTWNTIHENELAKHILFCFCIPGALVALLVPNWVSLPINNIMHLHSETVHILLFLYPMILIADGFKPTFRYFPKLVGFVVGLGLFDYFVDLKLDTNFMFLMRNEHNPALELLMNLTGKFYSVSFVLVLIVASALMIGLGQCLKKNDG